MMKDKTKKVKTFKLKTKVSKTYSNEVIYLD